MMERLKKIFKPANLKYVAAFLLPIVITIVCFSSVNNDTWFQLAEGEHIAKSGFFTVDPLSMHEGLNMTVQIPLYALSVHWINSIFGTLGIYIAMLCVAFVVMLIIYKLCMLLSDKNVNVSLIITLITSSMLGALGFFVTRPQMLSYIFFIGTIYILELYIKTKKTRSLWLLPVLSLLQINFHASLWWLLVIIMVVYLIDGFRLKKLHLEGYNKKPILFALLGMLLAGFANPYGYKAIFYVLTSFNAYPIKNFVAEMTPTEVLSYSGLIIWAIVAVVILVYIFGDRQRVRMRYLILFFGFLALGLDSQRGMAQLFLVLLFPLALMFKDFEFNKFGSEKVRSALSVWSGILAIYSLVGVCILTLPSAGETHAEPLRRGFEIIDADVAASGKDKSQLKIYTGYGDGAYFEYHGYKPYLDPRAEVFLKKNNGKEDILEEWYGLTKGAVKIRDFLDKYDFDYIFIRGDSVILSDLEDERYELIYKTGNDQGVSTEVYRRIRDE